MKQTLHATMPTIWTALRLKPFKLKTKLQIGGKQNNLYSEQIKNQP